MQDPELLFRIAQQRVRELHDAADRRRLHQGNKPGQRPQSRPPSLRERIVALLKGRR